MKKTNTREKERVAGEGAVKEPNGTKKTHQGSTQAQRESSTEGLLAENPELEMNESEGT